MSKVKKRTTERCQWRCLWHLLSFIQNQPLKVLCKKGVLKNFTNFTGKHLCQSLFLIKLKKKLSHRCFLVNFAKSLGTLFYRITPGGCFCFYLNFYWNNFFSYCQIFLLSNYARNLFMERRPRPSFPGSIEIFKRVPVILRHASRYWPKIWLHITS